MTSRQRIRGLTPTGAPQDLNITSRDRNGLLFCEGLTLTLFLVRFFYVAESADQGETLGIVGLWLVALLIWTIVSWRFTLPIAPLGWFDLGVGLLAGGHITSALVIVSTSGDKRSAINLAWEWLGVAIGWFLFRQHCREVTFRREVFAGIIAMGVSIAGLGLYQHYVELPRMAVKFGPMFDRLKKADVAEAAILRKAMVDENIPAEGPGATLFEKRLRDSHEPLGFFALANTLGGFLAVCLILSASVVISARTTNGAARIWLIGWIGIIVLIGWCLLLTKSRTAWIGTAIGLAILIYRMQGAKLTRARFLVAVGAFVLVVALAGLGLGRLGGLDQQVLTEAPKSLQYRLQYWSATSRMVWDHISFGVGPGQFRWHYLFYKLPEASEEISDPHNLFFDVAANGGVAALVGLIAICLLSAWGCRRVAHLSGTDKLFMPSKHTLVVSVIFGLASMTWLMFLFTGSDDRVVVLLPMAAVLFWGLRRTFGVFIFDPNAISIGFSSAALGLATHFCGAGGIGMPAASLLFLALIADSLETPNSAKTVSGRISTKWGGLVMGINVALLIAWFSTGFQPVTEVQRKLVAGDRLVQRGLNEAADAEYLSATGSDPWASEPWRRRAEMAYRKAEAEQYRSNDSFQIAVKLLQQAKLRDPAGFRDDRRLGEWWFARWLKTSYDGDVKRAVGAFEKAWALYPTNSGLMAELALALAGSKSEAAARDVSLKALNQDKINHERGHVDRFLDDTTRQKLEDLLDAPAEPKQRESR